MNLQHLYYFQTLARLQHFAKSAAELYITQPALSYAINSLEKELGVKLFERSSHFSRLTPAGAVFLKHINAALEELEKAKYAVQAVDDSQSSVIRVLTEKTFITAVILQSFQETDIYRDVDIKLTQSQSSSSDPYDQLRLNNCDIVFSTTFPTSSGIEFFEISDLPLVLLVNRSHPLAALDSVDLYELDWTQPVVVRSDSNSITVKRINSIYKMVGYDPAASTCRVRSSIALATLVEIGAGIGIASYFPQLDSFKNLKVLKISSPSVLNTLYVSRNANGQYTRTDDAFFSFVKEHYALSDAAAT